MKTTKLLMLALLCLSLAACSDDDDKAEPSVFEIQFKKMAHTWAATEVTLDGADKSTDFTSFKLVLDEGDEELLHTYATTGRPAGSPWKAAGEWAFDFNGEVTTKFQRDGGAEAIIINYVVTETTLQLTFGFVGDGYAAKTADATGTWVFKFEKE